MTENEHCDIILLGVTDMRSKMTTIPILYNVHDCEASCSGKSDIPDLCDDESVYRSMFCFGLQVVYRVPSMQIAIQGMASLLVRCFVHYTSSCLRLGITY